MLNATACAALMCAFALAAADAPEVVHVGMVAPDVIGITVRTGRAEHGRQVPYAPLEGDTVETWNPPHRWVKREGRIIGALVGPEGDVLQPFDRFAGPKLDTGWAVQPNNYVVASPDDAHYSAGLSPAAVHRKSKPTDLARTGALQFRAPLEHVLYLQLPKPLAAGKRYSVRFGRTGLAEQGFVYDPAGMRSEAVHVSHLGFRPDDPAKVAFLSCWMGSGGGLSYGGDLSFQVLEDASGRSVFTGKVALSKAADDRTEDAYHRNYNGTDVYEMDFTPLTEPGAYRVLVDGIGCSYPFPIADDAWRQAFTVSARGFYHQRSGIELGPPYTTFRRRRSFHPDDGVKIYASTTPLMDTGNGIKEGESNFTALVEGKTDETVADAWGGYMDAGDWDRRIQHVIVSRYLIELADLFPDYFAGLGLNIPESDDGLADVVSEALFNLDHYRRMQTPEGGIRGGVESEEHPRYGEGSWQETLTIMAYAPGVWSSYLYAGVAAQAANWLESRAPERAEVYRLSALRAMRWAEANLEDGKEYAHAVNDARNLAAAELFRLTGEAQWHDLFLATTVFKNPGAELFVWQDHEQRDAAWVYARTDRPGMDAEVKQNCLSALLREADDRAKGCERTAFRWTKFPWQPTSWGALTAPDAVSLVRAHALSGEARYLRAAVLACQSGAGANPVNMCYTTGLGHKSPLHPLHLDSRLTHQPPPAGLTVGGPMDYEQHRDLAGLTWGMRLVERHCYPRLPEWPTMEAYWDVYWYPAMCEFTPQVPMARNAYVWGYLAARGSN